MSEDGSAGSWKEVYRLHLSTDETWFHPKIRWSQIAGAGISPSATMQIRFTATDDAPAGTVEAAIDGVIVSTFLCDPVAAGDLNCNGSVGFDDINPFVALLVMG